MIGGNSNYVIGSGLVLVCAAFYLVAILVNNETHEKLKVQILPYTKENDSSLKKNSGYHPNTGFPTPEPTPEPTTESPTQSPNPNPTTKGGMSSESSLSPMLDYYFTEELRFDSGENAKFSHIRLAVRSEDANSMNIHFTYIGGQEGCKRMKKENLAPGNLRNLDDQAPVEDEGILGLGLCYRKTSSNTVNELKCTRAVSTGCVQLEDTRKTWHFFAARINNIYDGNVYQYQIGSLTRSTDGKLGLKDDRILPVHFINRKQMETSYAVVGDFGTNGVSQVSAGILSNIGLYRGLIHLGDASYSTNRGECYGSVEAKCQFDCSEGNPNCLGRHRTKSFHEEAYMTWFDFVGPIMSSIPWMTTTGNHDNDIIWFLKFRPPAIDMEENYHKNHKSLYREMKRLNDQTSMSSVQQQALVNSIGKEPYFYSYNDKDVHFVSIGTEDNFVNPYEMNLNNGKIKTQYRKRFEDHYGINSRQYKWLENDLKSVDRSVTPWVVVFTHRPMWHSSNHHASCTSRGDWYGCEFRELYATLFEKYHVNLVLGGHAHHYQRSKPMKMGVATKEKAPRYIVCGTGGFELDQPFDSNLPDWIAFRSADWFGYCQMTVVNKTHILWKHFSTGEKAQVETKDEAWIVQ